MTDLKSKTAIITGASRGIGAAAARLLAAQGARVVLAARGIERAEAVANEITEAGGEALAVRCDVARLDDVEALLHATIDRFGAPDILVNNAGLIDPIARLDESDPEGWERVIDVNLKGVYYGMRLVIPHMLRSGGGTILNISSGAATTALEGWSHYCASKAAVLALTRNADLEYRTRGIRVIGLSPGTVATDMQREIKESGINPVSQLDFDQHIPPEWVARAIIYLCGPAGDAFRGADFSLREAGARTALGLPVDR